MLAGLGATLKDAALPWPAATCLDAARLIGAAESAAIHERELRGSPQLVGAALRDKLLAGIGVRAVDYLAAQRFRRAFAEAMETLWAEHDVLLSLGAHGAGRQPRRARQGHRERRTAPADGARRAYVGNRANGTLADLLQVAEMPRGRRLAPRARMVAVPATQRFWRQAMAEGPPGIFAEAGAAAPWQGGSRGRGTAAPCVPPRATASGAAAASRPTPPPPRPARVPRPRSR